MSNIGKIELNFQVIDSKDPKFLLIADFSDWKVIEELPAFIEITLPGSRIPVVSNFHKNKINGFNSIRLGTSTHIDCEENFQDLPDGIYEICLKGGANGQRTFHRYYLKRDKFRLELNKAWTKLNLEYSIFDKDLRESLLIIEGFIKAASAAATLGEIPKARDYFNLAKSRLEAYKECKDCI